MSGHGHPARNGWRLPFAPQDLGALSAVTVGPVLLAGAPGFREEVGELAAAVAVGAADAADVVAAVRFAADFRLPITVLSPGHDPAEPEPGGMIFTTHRMNGVAVDRVCRTAVVGAGAWWSDVVRRASEVGLAPLAPPDSDVGVVGSAHGWSAGHVRAIEHVATDGSLRRVTPVGDPRAFRRLCTSDPDDVELGVVTGMTFALFR